MTLQRRLDDVETQLKGSAPSYCVEYQGRVDDRILADAFARLYARHPVLRARIVADSDGHRLFVPDDGSPDIVIAEGGEKQLRSLVTAPWDASAAVATLIHVRKEQSGGFVALRMDHAVTDGGIKMFLFRELWRRYTELVNGEDVPLVHGHSLPEPPRETIRRRWPGVSAERPARRDTARGTACRAIERIIQLDAGDTARLVTAARTRQTSVHALVCGAVLITQYAYGGTILQTPMLCLSPVDLRNRVTPPVHPMETTRFLGIHAAEVTVSTRSDPFAVGQVVKQKLDAAIKSRSLLTDPIQRPLPWVDSALARHVAHASVSNYGVIPTFEGPAELDITDFRTVSDAHTGPFPTYAVYTYQGRLNLRMVLPAEHYTDDDIDAIAASIVARLAAVAAGEFGASAACVADVSYAD